MSTGNDLSLIRDAQAYARAAHDSIGQQRKYTGEPYWMHTDRVAALVAEHVHDPEVVAAAHLHDVVEDVAPLRPEYNLQDIALRFGKRVALLVLENTKVSRAGDGNRAVRVALDRQHYAAASPDGQSIKLADLIDNTEDIVAHDEGFARLYLREKGELLLALTAGHPALRARAQRAWEDGVSMLGPPR